MTRIPERLSEARVRVRVLRSLGHLLAVCGLHVAEFEGAYADNQGARAGGKFTRLKRISAHWPLARKKSELWSGRYAM